MRLSRRDIDIWWVQSLREKYELIYAAQVSYLMPGRNGDWSVPKPDRGKGEIYLHTRRDSRWQRVE